MGRRFISPPTSYSALATIALRVSILIALVILWILPADLFDRGPIICPFKRFLDLECPGCGLTRGTQHFLHGEWEVTLDYNPLVAVVVPIVAVVRVVHLVVLVRFFWLIERFSGRRVQGIRPH